jgi:CheY-like chemotaxis protein
VKRIKVLLVDDSEPFARVAQDFLERNDNLQALPYASSGAEALQRIAADSPDLVLMDVNMPVMNGFEAARRIRLAPSPPRIVMISFEDTPRRRAAAEAAGADAFVPKDRFKVELPELIDRLFPGRRADFL